jgi:putative protease
MSNKFNITSGFNSLESVHKMKEAGATELYGGFLPKELDKKWPIAFNILNRRGEDANFSDWNEFEKAVNQARKYNLPVFATFNGLYIEKQYKTILNLIDKVSSLKGIKGIIVNDISLLLLLKERKYKKEIAISTGGTTFNADTVQFYKSLGAKRIILDRQLSIEDIIKIIKADDSLDYEVFGFGGSCFFIDGFCSFFHCSEKLNYKNKIIKTYNTKQINYGCDLIFSNILNNNLIYNKKNNVNPSVFFENFRHNCNLCKFYELKKFNNVSLKIVNRLRGIQVFVKIVKLACNKLEGKITKKQYINFCKKILSENNIFECKETQCYYK